MRIGVVPCRKQWRRCGASDLRAVIRGGADDAGLVDAIRLAVDAKPQGHDFHIVRHAAPAVARHMSTTGG